MKAAPTVQPLLTFGQCLKNILGARKLSASALSRMMEQKSRNSMFRILDDTGGPAVQAAFFESLKASDCLHLTEQEERELERALEVSRFGVAGYMTNQAMHRLLGDVDLQAATDDSLRVDRSRDGSVTRCANLWSGWPPNKSACISSSRAAATAGCLSASPPRSPGRPAK